MALSSHPTDARYFASRSSARQDCQHGERVIRLGVFAGGSFGRYPPQLSTGRYIGGEYGGPIPSVTIWMVTAQRGQ